MNERPRRVRPECPLTPREMEILAEVAEGNSNRVIGLRLGISEQTVKNHLAKVLQRLRAPDRTAAVVIALRNGWLDLQRIEVAERSDERRVA
ncbi:MAG TPA: LuxR C-terminal-related transcriptional regulator [Chloroflexota bacterium]|nr:LuxR C-terminal-related transcriptional regulator [Chloroflexota bacterium]